MFYVLYDKNFNALGKRKTYPCQSWSLRIKANEFNELKMEGMGIESDVKAVYAGLHQDSGELKHFAFAGVPVTSSGKTVINAVDIRQLLNNETIIDLTAVETVSGIYTELLTCLFSGSNKLNNLGVNIESPDLTETVGITFKSDSIEKSKGVENVWKVLQATNSVYDCYVDVVVNFVNKKIKFVVKQINNLKSIKLTDFGHPKLKVDGTVINRSICYNSTLTTKETYYLLNDDSVVAESSVDINKIIYPVKSKVFQEATIAAARVKGIQELYKNRFKQSVELSKSESGLGYLLDELNLTYKADIYDYKVLPVMEVFEDSKGAKKVKFGRLEEFWWV